MPGMNGFDTTEAILANINESKFDKCFIIACTAYSDHRIHEQCLESGMDSVIQKPICIN